MFDIAYEIEATIVAAEIEKEKIWDKLLDVRMDLSKPMNGFCECMELARMSSILTYCYIMYNTHGV